MAENQNEATAVEAPQSESTEVASEVAAPAVAQSAEPDVDAAIVANGGTVDERLDALEAENVAELRSVVEENDVEVANLQVLAVEQESRIQALEEKLAAVESAKAAPVKDDVDGRLRQLEARLGY